MEGQGYEYFRRGGKGETYQVAYRRVMGDLEPPGATPSPQVGVRGGDVLNYYYHHRILLVCYVLSFYRLIN